jgi:hypothetical protein
VLALVVLALFAGRVRAPADLARPFRRAPSVPVPKFAD